MPAMETSFFSTASYIRRMKKIGQMIHKIMFIITKCAPLCLSKLGVATETLLCCCCCWFFFQQHEKLMGKIFIFWVWLLICHDETMCFMYVLFPIPWGYMYVWQKDMCTIHKGRYGAFSMCQFCSLLDFFLPSSIPRIINYGLFQHIIQQWNAQFWFLCQWKTKMRRRSSQTILRWKSLPYTEKIYKNVRMEGQHRKL
jgi:hypothetical protein